MDRLTERLSTGVIKRTEVNDKNRGESIMKRLAAYEDAEEQGLLVRLPCKVGDKVYSTEHRYPLEIDAIVIHDHLIEYQWVSYERGVDIVELYDDGSFADEDVGKTVFLTPEEAEAALKERAEQ